MKINQFGAVAQCVFSQVLEYFDMLDMMSVPTSHGLLRGVTHDNLLWMFNPLDYKPQAPKPRYRQTRS